jgi:8-oxo-dGTP pyrophosphatase MutT (NUDIX family)
MNDNSTTATPYLAVYVLLRRGDEVFCILRAHTGWMDGKYGLPAGRVEKGESFMQAALREAHEEAGVVIQRQDLKPVITWQRHEQDSD